MNKEPNDIDKGPDAPGASEGPDAGKTGGSDGSEIEGWNESDPPVKEDSQAEEYAEDPQAPVVCIKGLRKAFTDHEVLRGVDLHVNKGENLVVLGKSGSGKSVLIKCLVRLEWPDEGELVVFGKDISALSYDELNEMRLKTGFLFQNAALYDSMTVRENLAFPLKQHKKKVPAEKREELIMEMLDNVGLADSIDQMPSKLSGGQQKRIGLARTLILRPELMLYDEPTTGLDTGTAREISELMIKMKHKYHISSITITHDMACARMTADRIIMMKEGVIVAEGSYSALEKSDDEWVQSFFS
ncbi:MAG TPA: ATP-binding cassette domain-containing protein [Puia sp.]|nr:ATP-binding cassette domain-containing protein [Puia sp.]